MKCHIFILSYQSQYLKYPIIHSATVMIYAIFYVLHLDFNSHSFHRLYLLGIPYLIQLEICHLLLIFKLQLETIL